jgi:hypothetical protein
VKYSDVDNNKRFKTLYCHDGERGSKLIRATRWASFTRNFLRSGFLAETSDFITTEQSFQVAETASYNTLRLPICNKRNQKDEVVTGIRKYACSVPVDEKNILYVKQTTE